MLTYTNPEVVNELATAWHDAAREALGITPGSPDMDPDSPVVACLAESSLPAPFDHVDDVEVEPAGVDGEAWEKLVAVLDEMVPDPTKIPVPGEEPSPEWTAYLAAEETLVSAVWECQDESYIDSAMEQVAIASDEFAEDYSEQIAEAVAAWERTRDKATELGWAPDRPLAGYPLGELPTAPAQ
ncbi:MAG: hypothetical protein HZY75_15740 [Nocardioidaceae bacterium]|nr:MAG: hypothetical protein HZY75_15740 [Nocardioidaceae bacterium]